MKSAESVLEIRRDRLGLGAFACALERNSLGVALGSLLDCAS